MMNVLFVVLFLTNLKFSYPLKFSAKSSLERVPFSFKFDHSFAKKAAICIISLFNISPPCLADFQGKLEYQPALQGLDYGKVFKLLPMKIVIFES